MLKTKLVILAFAILVGMPTFADSSFKSKAGFDWHTFKSNPDSQMGWIAGGRYGWYFGSSNISLGLAGYVGTPTGGNIGTEHVAFGGFLLSWEYRVKRLYVIELDLMVGVGEGMFRESGLYQRSFYTVQPSISIGGNLGDGWRFSGVLSYVHLSRAPQFSGFMVGFRFDLRSGTATKMARD